MKAQWLSIKELGGSEEEVKTLLNKMAKRSSWKGSGKPGSQEEEFLPDN